MLASITLAVFISQAALKSEDVLLGTGEAVKQYDVIEVFYTGTLVGGKEFDSNVKTGKSLRFQVGVGRVIKGWDLGVIGMKPNGERKLIVPPDLAYGPEAFGNLIPANSTLNFTIKLSKLIPSSKITVIAEGKGEQLKLGQFVDCKLSVKSSTGNEIADPTKESRLALSPKILPGINQAIGGIKVGEKRKVIVNSELAFGDKGFPPVDQNGKKAGSVIPPKSDLIIEIEATKISG